MNAVEIENAMRTAAMSLAMEGQHVDAQCAEWCRQLLASEILLEEYPNLVTLRAME